MHTSHPSPADRSLSPYPLTRRQFLTVTAVAGGTLLLGLPGGTAMSSPAKSRLTLARTPDRAAGVTASIRALEVNPVKGRQVLLKPNFNTADPAPGSTHNDTLTALVKELWAMGAKSIALGERSYPPTAQVMEQKGIRPLMRDLDVTVIDFDRLDEKDWVRTDAPGSHWRDGFRVARPVLEAECLVSTCCCKTHQYGGVFTMSLKLHVGVVPTRRHGYDYMTELHSSPHQRLMIAEINAPFSPDLIVMEAVEVFVDGGPMSGKRARADLVLAGTDRVAMDAAGLALLKGLGSNRAIMDTPIYAQEQISRAVELGLGAPSPENIELVAANQDSRGDRDSLAATLSRG